MTRPELCAALRTLVTTGEARWPDPSPGLAAAFLRDALDAVEMMADAMGDDARWGGAVFHAAGGTDLLSSFARTPATDALRGEFASLRAAPRVGPSSPPDRTAPF